MKILSQYINREKALLVMTGICGAVAMWGSIVLLYGGFCLLGGE